jgi:hypothetical protein
MTSYDKRRVFQLLGDGKTHVLTSKFIKNERLQIRVLDSEICLNKIDNDEWTNMTKNRTNSVRSSSFSILFESFGCLGLLSIPKMNHHYQQSSNMHHFLFFVNQAASIGTIYNTEVMRITEVNFIELETNYKDNNSPIYNYVNEIK